MDLLPQDWASLFHMQAPLFELIIRGTVIYFFILLLLRIMPRRTGGELEMMDLIIIVLIGEAATHSFAVYRSITDGIFLIAVLIIWNFLLNYLSYHFSWVERLLTPPPLQVVRHGKLLLRNMRKEFLTKDELMEKLRDHGIEDLRLVKAAYIEGDGKLSVIRTQ